MVLWGWDLAGLSGGGSGASRSCHQGQWVLSGLPRGMCKGPPQEQVFRSFLHILSLRVLAGSLLPVVRFSVVGLQSLERHSR